MQVCHGANADEREQYEAFSGEKYDPDTVATQLFVRNDPKWTIYAGEAPVVVFGFTRIRPGVWQDWLVSTPEAWKTENWKAVTRRLRKVADAMLETEAHRLQCISLRSRIQAHAWYRVLCLSQEGALRAYGADGQDALMFARVKVRE